MGRSKHNSAIPTPENFPISGLNREHLSRIFGVSLRTIATWLVKGMPRQEDGFNLPDCITWFAGQQVGQSKKQSHGQEPEPENSIWLERYRKERARMARLDRMARQGSLLPKEEMEKAFTDRAFEFARGVLHLSRRVAHKVAEKSSKPLRDVERILDLEARRLLEEYSRPIEVKETRQK